MILLLLVCLLVLLLKKLLNMINEKPSGSIHANMAGRASFFNGNVRLNKNFSKYFYSNSSLSMITVTMGWIIDSGANQHLTRSITGMSNVVDISELKITVGHPNGTLATIKHVGNLKLANNVMLYDVFVVLGYCVSLMLVHPADQVLAVLKNDLSIFDNTSMPMCETCQRAKQTREPFPLSDHKSKNLADVENTSEVDHLQFFNGQFSQSPNDDGKDSSVEEGSLPHSYNIDSVQGRTHNDGLTATQVDDQNWSEGNVLNSQPNITLSTPTQSSDEVQTRVLRRSERQSKLLIRLNDYSE
ncbi:hypothetical protein Tco_1197533 [Tanacetum coccineum]